MWLSDNGLSNLILIVGGLAIFIAITMLFLLHSANVFPLDYARRLLEAAPGPKELVELRGTHNDAFFDSLPAVIEALRKFLIQS